MPPSNEWPLEEESVLLKIREFAQMRAESVEIIEATIRSQGFPIQKVLQSEAYLRQSRHPSILLEFSPGIVQGCETVGTTGRAGAAGESRGGEAAAAGGPRGRRIRRQTF